MGIDGQTLIGVKGTSIDENKAFVTIAKHFQSKGLNVPKVFDVSEDWTFYIQEDLGDDILFKATEQGRKCGKFNDEEKVLLKKTVALLPDLQFRGAEGMDFSVCYPQPEFDKRMISFDLNYFKY